MDRVWSDRVAVDNQGVAAGGAQGIRCCASEIDCGARIHDRENDIALGNESLDRTDIRQSGLARQRTATLAAALQRRVDMPALRLELNRYRLAHVTGAHHADTLDLHLLVPRLRHRLRPVTRFLDLQSTAADGRKRSVR